MAVLNLEDQLCFYRAYHRNSTNVFVHIVGVPTILFTSIVLLSNIPLPLSSFSKLASFTNFNSFNALNGDCEWLSYANLGSLLTVCFSLFYLLLDSVYGFIFSAIISSFTISINHYMISHGIIGLNSHNNLLIPMNDLNKLAILLFVLSWIIQFIGHGVFEKRAPALFSNLVQALVLAPFFIFFELMFFAGFRLELKHKMDKRVDRILYPNNQKKAY
ncbi:2-hydroxy-palmitic acid dioxygenase MPO1 [Ascoidea rubescens DSM 1968]|uniref:DUF962-domain-containing protein n=1 Tax=Ascoidea rubescens DSM 1968 TaxID=1344418 RepID=A0A1D2VB49_9ASCO|nr:DUF962-domain-containing protein [Ascoidea rubescens DSM 1968]ODV58882.1 DUF962-domain-containing protein [Ascoidea rubescens DSM 1968]